MARKRINKVHENVAESFKQIFRRKYRIRYDTDIVVKSTGNYKNVFGNYYNSSELSKRPVVLLKPNGTYEIMIPDVDIPDLNYGIIRSYDYCDKSMWYYGYILSENHFFWKKRAKGIQRGLAGTRRFNRYMRIMKCHLRTYKPGYEGYDCRWCTLRNCPFQGYNCIPQPDGERGAKNIVLFDFYKAMRELLKSNFNLDIWVSGAYPEAIMRSVSNLPDDENDKIYIINASNHTNNKVEVILPRKLLLDILYFPEEYNVDNMIKKYPLYAARIIKDNFGYETLKVTSKTTTSDLNVFWSNASNNE